MTTLLTLLMLQATAAEPVAGKTYVAIDRAAWLHASADLSGRRMRPSEQSTAAPHTPTPVTILEVVHMGAEVVEVRPVNMPPPLNDQFQILAPDITPAGWPHCYPPPVGLSQIAALFHVDRDDLLPVLAADTTVTLPDGSTVAMQRGLALSGGDGRYRVRSHHIQITVPLDDSLVSDHFSLEPRVPAAVLELESTEGKLSRAHPQLRARLGVVDDQLVVRSPPASETLARTLAAMHDRCIDITFATPQARMAVASDERMVSWPIYAPIGARVTWSDGVAIGLVSEGQLPIWTRSGCEWSAEAGMCCKPAQALEIAGVPDDMGVCYEADPPEQAITGLSKLIGDQARDHSEFVTALYTGERSISWSLVNVDGALTPEQVTEQLATVDEALTYCYTQGLSRDAYLAGALDVRFTTMPNGRVYEAEAIWYDKPVQEQHASSCVERTVSKLSYLDQIGQPPTSVHMRIVFDK